MSRRIRVFKRWMKFNGIVQSDALELVDSAYGGISVRALCDLKEGDLVATIPKLACLTIRTSGLSSLIEASGLGGCLGLAVALMYERSLGAASPWEGYLQLLPERECMPLVWSLVDVDELLSGTELHKTVKEDKEFLYDDWKEYIEPLIQAGPLKMDHISFGIDHYFAAKSLVSSRSFEIDEYHGFGMVPLADLFNHKTRGEHVHFTLASSCSSDDEDDVDVFDAYDEEMSPLRDFTKASGNDPSITLEMIVVKEVEAGAEVFNIYGQLGNAAMLHRYGFTELGNPFDIVNIDLDLVLQWGSSLFSNRYCRARLALWKKLNYSGCTSHDSEYFEIAFGGEPQTELLILLYIFFLSESIYQKLNCMIDYFIEVNEAAKLIKLVEFTGTNSQHKSEDLKELLLIDDVCHALVSLADLRENLYGLSSLKEDMCRLQRCCRVRERKLYHSLVLRVGERKLLGRLRAYARKRFRMMNKKHGLI